MMLFLALLVCPITAGVGNRDRIYFHTSFSCHYTSKLQYTYSLFFFEDDISQDQPMTNWILDQKIIGGGVNKTDVIYNAIINTDYGLKYEFGVTIKHNCLRSGKDVTVKVDFTENYCKIQGGDCHVYVPIDLTGLLEGSKRQVRIEQKAN